MTEIIEIKGEWFIPASKEMRIHGVLSFDPQTGTDLELYGSLEGDDFLPEFKDQKIILGLTSDSKQVTLYGCFMTKSGGATLVQGEESGKPTTTYSIKYLLIGLHVDSADDLKFDQIATEIFNLGEWVGISGFKKQNRNRETHKKHGEIGRAHV